MKFDGGDQSHPGHRSWHYKRTLWLNARCINVIVEIGL